MDADVSKFVSQVSQYAGLIRQYAKERFEITTFYAYLIGESFTLSEVKRANPFFKKAYYFDYLFCPNYPVDGGENRRDGEMYIEVIKYSTLLERAVFRNKIFTDKILLLSGKKRQNHIFSTNIISYTCFTKKGLSFEAM
ncbi:MULTISPECIES: hypothetical protein [Bacteroides]|uniref:hypothetical protein n=1 Tax=Bacteroides TaxID=816 RepID=UPI0026773E82|nr:hypothetical protein [Bacteroides acidifaciens]